MKKNIWYIYFIISCLIVLIASISQHATLLMLISTLCGVIYSLLVAKNVKYSLLFGIVNVSTYGYILFTENIYGGFFINIFYSLPMLVYGYYNWNKASKKDDYGIKKLSTKTRERGSIAIVITILIYSIVLKLLGGSNILLDSISSILGYVGIYLLTNRYVEQWNIWIISNLANVVLWIALTIEDISNLSFMIMWIVYFVNSFYGYINWNNKVK